MTKLLQQLSFSSSNYYDNALIEPNAAADVKEKTYGDGASSLSAAGSKRSALSATDAECFSLCLGAGPLCFAPPGGVDSGASSPASPSTPTHDDNRDLLSALLWASASSLTNSSQSLESEPREQPRSLHEQQAVVSKILERKDRQPVKIDFKIFLTENTCTRWEAVVEGGTIYLRMPLVLSAGSKDSFMLLLDFAQETLACNNCIVCVLSATPERASLLRTFMFLGFTPLPPAARPAALHHPDYILLYYNMQ